MLTRVRNGRRTPASTILSREPRRLLTDPERLGPALSALPIDDLVKLSVLVDTEQKRRYHASILAVLRAVTGQAVRDGTTDSSAPVVRVGIQTADWDENPPQWSDTGLTLYHADGAITPLFDASHSDLETLLPALTCVDRPASGDVLNVDLVTGDFDR